MKKCVCVNTFSFISAQKNTFETYQLKLVYNKSKSISNVKN